MLVATVPLLSIGPCLHRASASRRDCCAWLVSKIRPRGIVVLQCHEVPNRCATTLVRLPMLSAQGGIACKWWPPPVPAGHGDVVPIQAIIGNGVLKVYSC